MKNKNKRFLDMNTDKWYKHGCSFEKLTEYYPSVHLIGNLYLVRRYANKKFSLWDLCDKSKYPPETADLARAYNRES